MQSESNETCTIHHKDEGQVKSAPQNILEGRFVIIPQGTQGSSARSISGSGSGATAGAGLLGTPRGRPGEASSILGLEMLVLQKLECQGGCFSGIRQEALLREGQRVTSSSPNGSRWAATTPNKPWEICTEEAAICALPSQNTPPSPLELQ